MNSSYIMISSISKTTLFSSFAPPFEADHLLFLLSSAAFLVFGWLSTLLQPVLGFSLPPAVSFKALHAVFYWKFCDFWLTKSSFSKDEWPNHWQRVQLKKCLRPSFSCLLRFATLIILLKLLIGSDYNDCWISNILIIENTFIILNFVIIYWAIKDWSKYWLDWSSLMT